MKSYKLHIDALIVIGGLFVASVVANIFLLQKYSAAADLTIKQELTIMVNELNLSSQAAYIKKFQEQCDVDINKN